MPATAVRPEKKAVPPPRANVAAGIAERPLIDFDRLDGNIKERLLDATRYMGGKFPPVEKTKFQRKTKGLFNTFIHKGPAGVFNQLTDFKYSGTIAYLRGKLRDARHARVRKGAYLEERFREAFFVFQKTITAERAKLQTLKEQGTIRPDNVGQYMQSFNQVADRALIEFKGSIKDIIADYSAELQRRRLIGKHHGKAIVPAHVK